MVSYDVSGIIFDVSGIVFTWPKPVDAAAVASMDYIDALWASVSQVKTLKYDKAIKIGRGGFSTVLRATWQGAAPGHFPVFCEWLLEFPDIDGHHVHDAASIIRLTPRFYIIDT